MLNKRWGILDGLHDLLPKEDVCSVELLELFQIFDQQSVSKCVFICACMHNVKMSVKMCLKS